MNVIWYTGSKIIILLSRILLLMWTSRHLKALDFGVFHGFSILISFIMIFPEVGIGQSLIKEKHISKYHINTAFTSYLLFSLVVALILFIFSSQIAGIFNIVELNEILKSIFWLPIFVGISSISRNLALKALEIKKISLIELSSYIFIYLPGIFITYKFEPNYLALVYPYVAQITFESLIFYLLKKEKYHIDFDKKSWNELIVFGGWNSVGTIIGMIGNQSDGFIIGKFFGSQSLGLYNRGYSIMSILQNIYSQYLDKVMLAEFVKMKDTNFHLQKILRTEYVLNLLILPAIAIVLVATNEIITIMLGINWLKIEKIVQILMIGLLFRINYKINNQYLKSQGYIKNTVIINVRYLFVTVFFMLSLSYFGLVGVATGYSLGLGFQYWQLHEKVQKVIKGYTYKKFIEANKFLILKFACLIILFLILNPLLNKYMNVYLSLFTKVFIILIFYLKDIYHEIYLLFLQNKSSEKLGK